MMSPGGVTLPRRGFAVASYPTQLNVDGKGLVFVHLVVERDVTVARVESIDGRTTESGRNSVLKPIPRT